jgi:hypothetical protein
MPLCRGIKEGNQCNYLLFKSSECGIVGCQQGQEGKCTNQAFKTGLCLRCSSIGKQKEFRPGSG